MTPLDVAACYADYEVWNIIKKKEDSLPPVKDKKKKKKKKPSRKGNEPPPLPKVSYELGKICGMEALQSLVTEAPQLQEERATLF